MNLFGRKLFTKLSPFIKTKRAHLKTQQQYSNSSFFKTTHNTRAFWTKSNSKTVNFIFINTREGTEHVVDAKIGDNLLSVAHANKIDLEGAWEASLACSTCHIILEDDIYDDLEYPWDEEDDLLDLAYGLIMTSRLGCQVLVTKEMEGMKVKIPSASRNFYVDGHVPKPH